jgi:ABC-2 type transport system permease protein
MTWALYQRWIGQGRWLLLACGAALFAFCWLRVWIISQLDISSFEVILRQVWEKYERFSPVSLDQLLTYNGRVAVGFEEPVVLLCLSVWAIARGSNTVSGHIHSGVMEMLLAQPVSRSALFVSQTLVTLSGLVFLSLCMWTGLAVGIHTTEITERYRPSIQVPLVQQEIPLIFLPEKERTLPMSERTSARIFIHPTINLFCLGVFLTGLTSLLSACDRYRWRTIGIVVGLVVVQMIMQLVSVTAPSLRWLAYGTFLSAFEPQIIVSVVAKAPQEMWTLLQRDAAGSVLRPGPLGYHLLLLIPGLFCLWVANFVFCRRDLPAPL